MTRLLRSAAIVVVMVSFGLFAGPAEAHERRTVGPYTFVVGWAVEPAYADQVNGVELIVTDSATTKAVEGLDKTLTVEIVAGGGAATKRLTLAPTFGQPGHYEAKVMPTKSGDYTFHITGTAGATKVDEKFESGPGRFDGVADSAAIRFPATVDVGSRLDEVNGKATFAIALSAAALVASIASVALSRRR